MHNTMCIMKGCRLYDQIRRRINAQCGALGWGTDALAVAAGVHRNTAGAVRAGKGNPTIGVIEKMLDALDAVPVHSEESGPVGQQ